MAESFENLDDILADRVNENVEKSFVEAVDSYDKQEKERKSRFSVENDLTKLLERSQSNATKVRSNFFASKLTNSLSKSCLRLIYLKKKIIFSMSKLLFSQIGVRKETSQHHFLKWTARN